MPIGSMSQNKGFLLGNFPLTNGYVVLCFAASSALSDYAFTEDDIIFKWEIKKAYTFSRQKNIRNGRVSLAIPNNCDICVSRLSLKCEICNTKMYR